MTLKLTSQPQLEARVVLLLCVFCALCALYAGASPAFADAPLPQFAKARMGSNLFTSDQVKWAAGPPGRALSAYGNGFIRFWDTTSEKMLWEVQTERQFNPVAVAFAGPDEAVVVLENGLVLVLHLKDGSEARRFQLKGHSSIGADNAEIRVANNVLLTAFRAPDTTDDDIYNPPTTLQTWSLADGAPLQSVLVPGQRKVALSPDGSLAAWLSENEDADDTLSFAPTSNLSAAKPLFSEAHGEQELRESFEDEFEDYPESLFFRPDNTLLVHGSYSGIRLWTLVDGAAKDPRTCPVYKPTEADIEKEYRLPSATPIVDGTLLSADGQYLLAQTSFLHADRVVDTVGTFLTYYETKTCTPLKKPPANVVWASNSESVPEATDGVIRPAQPWFYFSKKPVEHTPPFRALAVSPDGTRAAAISLYFSDAWSCTAETIVWASNSPPKELSGLNAFIFWLSDSKVVTLNSPTSRADYPYDMRGNGPDLGDAFVWDLTKTAQNEYGITTVFNTHFVLDPSLSVVAPLQNGQWIACQQPLDENGHPSGPKRFVRLNADFTVDPSAQYKPVPESCDINTDAISTDSERAIISIKNDAFPFALVDLNAETPLALLPQDAILSPDGQHIAYIHETPHTANTPRTCNIHLQNSTTKTTQSFPVPTLHFDDDQCGSRLTFSPDGKALLYRTDTPTDHRQNTLHILPLTASPALTKPFALTGHHLPIDRFAFSADKKTLVTLQTDGLMYAWDWPAILAAAQSFNADATTPKKDQP